MIVQRLYVKVTLWKKTERRIVIKFLRMKGLGARRIRTKLSRVLGDDCYSPTAIEHWLVRFREGDLLCANHSRSGRTVIDISECLRAFLDKFPFVSANMMSEHFHIARGTIIVFCGAIMGLKSSPADGCLITQS
jgi:hypothetical protein